MPRCGCADSCSCLVTAGSGVTVEGIGTLERPYEISAESGELEGRLVFDDSGSVDFTAIGAGSRAAPLVVSGDVALVDLSDVTDDAPTDGAGPVWRTDHWEWETPTTAAIPVSGVWGTAPLDIYGSNQLIGRETYIDSAGQLRTKPDEITGRLVTDLSAAYPTGTSVMYISNADKPNWPGGQLLVTHKIANGVIAQWCYLWSAASAKSWYRNGTTTAWSPWVVATNSATPHISKNKTAVQALTAAATYYTIIFEEDMIPPVGITYSGGVFTVPEDGIYQLNANICWTGTLAAQTRLSITCTNPTEAAVNFGLPTSNGQGTSMQTFCRAIRLKAGATMTISAYSSVTGNSVSGSTNNYTTMSLTKIAP